MNVPSEFPELDDGDNEIKAVARCSTDLARFEQSQRDLDDLFSPWREIIAGTSGTRRPSSASFTPPPEVADDPLEKMMNESDDSAHEQLLKIEAQPALQHSPRLERVTKMVSDFRQREPFRKYKDRPAVLAASTELVQSMLAHIEKEVAGV